MREIKLKLYSIIREIFKTDEITLKFDNDNITINDILNKLIDTPNTDSMKQIYDKLQFVGGGKSLRKYDKIPSDVNILYVLPPSSGGLIDIKVLTNEHIDINKLIEGLYNDENVGAIAIFIGIVRKVNKNEKVEKLHYEHSEELILDKLKEIAIYGINKYNLFSVVIYHYVGERKPGDLTMIVAVSGESRKNVFPALEELVDKVKHEAPIWKQEYRESGKYFILGDEQVKADEISKININTKRSS